MKKKTINLLLILMIFVFCFSIIEVSATCSICGGNHVDSAHNQWNDCPICHKSHPIDQLDPLQKSAYDMSCVVFAGTAITDTIKSTLKFDITSADFLNLWETAKDFYEIFSKLGELLCILFLLIAATEESASGFLSSEHLWKYCIKILIGVIIIRNGFDAITAIMNFATGTYNTLDSTSTSITSPSSCSFFSIMESNLLEGIAKILELVPAYIAMMVATVILNLVCWARILDIITRICFAPIAMSDMMVKGTRSNGLRYLKKLLSSALQGAVLLGGMRAYGTIISAMQSSGQISQMVVIVLAFALISSMFKAQQVSDDIVGV